MKAVTGDVLNLSQTWNNAGVTKMFKAEGCRSTSMGDLAFKDGKTFVVARFGFEEVVL